MSWTLGSSRLVTMMVTMSIMMMMMIVVVVSVHRAVVHAFTPVVTWHNPPVVHHRMKTIRMKIPPFDPRQLQRRYGRSTVAWRMSDPPVDDTMEERTTAMGSNGIAAAAPTASGRRTSTVFLLTPDDPIASLSASPYTFPTAPWRRTVVPRAVVAEEAATVASSTIVETLPPPWREENHVVTPVFPSAAVNFNMKEANPVVGSDSAITTATMTVKTDSTTTTTDMDELLVVDVEDNEILDDFMVGRRDDETDDTPGAIPAAVVATEEPSPETMTDDPNTSNVTLSDDQKVVHDLFLIDDTVTESIAMVTSRSTDVDETVEMMAAEPIQPWTRTTVEDHVMVTDELGPGLEDQDTDVVPEMHQAASAALAAEAEPRDGTIAQSEDEKVVHDLFMIDDSIKTESITTANRSMTTALTSDDVDEMTIMAVEPVQPSTTTAVEDIVMVTDEVVQVLQGNDEKDTDAVVIAPAMPSSTTGSTAAVAIEEPSDVRATMSEDENVVNDLFIINDVFGIYPMTAMETTSTNMEQQEVEIIDTENANIAPIKDDTDNVPLTVDDTVNIDTVEELPLAALSTIMEESSDDSASEPETVVTMLELGNGPSEQVTASEKADVLYDLDLPVAAVDTEEAIEVFENPSASRVSNELAVHSEEVSEESFDAQPIFSDDGNVTSMISDNDADVSKMNEKPILTKSAPDKEPFILQYDNDDETFVVSELMVKPPSTPPQLSQFAQFQPSIVFAMTREERIALAERSFLSLEIKPGVKVETIKGAAIATFVVALLAGDELPIAMFAMAPTVASFAITRGKTGETIRIIGDLSWLWTAKGIETLSTLDASQLIPFWNTVQSISSNALMNFGSWVEQQSRLAEEEYNQKQSAVANIKTPQQPENMASEHFFMSTTDHVPATEIEEMPLSSTMSQPDLSFEKELDDIQLLLQEAELEHIAAKARCEQKVKESNQRQLLITKLEMDRRAARMKQLMSDRRAAMLQIEEELARKKSIEANRRSLLECRLAIENLKKARLTRLQEDNFSKKKAESSQRSLLEARLKLDRQYITIVNESSRLASEANKRKSMEAKQRSLLESRLELERQVAAQSKITAQKADINTRRKIAEAKQRSLLETQLSIRKRQMLRAEADVIARMEKEKAMAENEDEKRRVDDSAERTRLVQMEEQTRQREAEKRRMEAVKRLLAQGKELARQQEEIRIAELSKDEDQTRVDVENRRPEKLVDQMEEATGRTVDDVPFVTADLTQTEIINPPPNVPTKNAPWVGNSSMGDPMETLKPNIVAAKALLESVRKGESYQFKKEWWE